MPPIEIENDEKFNVLLITIDCLRADHVGSLGYPRNTTPNIDKLAESGVLFTSAFSTGPSTQVSFSSIFTSTYPLSGGGYSPLPPDKKTIVEILKEQKYQTAGFHSNPYLSKYFGYDRGFDHFKYYSKEQNKIENMIDRIADPLLPTRDFPTELSVKEITIERFGLLLKMIKYYFLTKDVRQCLPADILTEHVISWIKNTSGNFFLWVHYMDTHFPFYPNQRFLKEFSSERGSKMDFLRTEYLIKNNPKIVSKDTLQRVIDIYDSDIKFIDYNINLLLNELGEKRKKTLILLTADHGEEFKDHGDFSHKAKLYDELIHVPLIISGPGIPSDKKVDHPVSLMDLVPTIVDHLGYKKTSDFQGKSLMPTINKDEPTRDGIICEMYKEKKAVLRKKIGKRMFSYRTDKWKYIEDEEYNRTELYDLLKDPKEKNNIVNLQDEIAKEFTSIIDKHRVMEERDKKSLGILKIRKHVHKLKGEL